MCGFVLGEVYGGDEFVKMVESAKFTFKNRCFISMYSKQELLLTACFKIYF